MLYAVMEFQEEAFELKNHSPTQISFSGKVGKIMAEWTLERIYLSENQMF